MSILEEAQALFEYTRTIRRDLHQHPELGFEEVRTAGMIHAELNKLGIEHRSGVAKTGVIAMIDGDATGPVVLLRFDMDALPVQEETGVDYASQTPGKMHACGHDGHIAVGLTVARLLNQRRHELHGAVKIMFQPAEESAGGAEGMIQEGVLENPKPDLALSLHIWNEKPLGWIGVVPGPFMAASDIFTVKVSGVGGHAAFPNQTVDSIVALAQIVNNLQSIVSRSVSPLQSAVVSVTRLSAGDTFNVIPPSGEMWGTIRTFESSVRETVIKRFHEVVNGTVAALGCQVEIHLDRLTPAVVNDPKVAQALKSVFTQMMPDHQVDTEYRTMGSEDMAYILQQVPGCYFFVGSANAEKNLIYSHHHPRFNFDESVLPQATALMTSAVMHFLAS